MATFKTTDGAEWSLAVNVGTIKRCLEDTGVRLTDLFSSGGNVADLFSDDVKFSEVIWSLVRPQAVSSGKTADDFFQAITGQVIEEAAEALLAELVDFFQEPRRTLLRRVLEKHQAARGRWETEELAAASQRLETMTDLEILGASVQTHSSSATSSPGAAA